LVQPSIWSKKFVLFVENLSVSFDGFKAVDIPQYGIEHGELRVIIGPNGAGKTTFCDLVSGKTKPSTGRVYFNGKEITQMEESDIALSGIGRKFQTPTVFDSLTTYENLLLALPGNQGWKNNLLSPESKEEVEKIDEILEKVSLIDQREMPAKSLSHGQRQWLAISALIISKPKLLLVDEPAAGLTDLETEQTADLLLELAQEHTIVVIEHDMDFVRRLGKTVTVLNEGKVLAEGMIDEMERNEEVMEAYLGR
jgi:urea transport system ATP-binding protein